MMAISSELRANEKRGCRFGETEEGQRRQHPLAVEDGVTKDRAGMRSTDLMKAGMPFRAWASRVADSGGNQQRQEH